MLRYALFTLITLWFAPPAQAQYWATRAVCDVSMPEIHADALAPLTKTTLHKKAADLANPTGRFWQITAPNGAVSHLWGTMHSSDPAVLHLPDRVMKAIATARVVAPELDPTFTSRRAFETRYDNGMAYRALRSTFVFDSISTGLPPDVIEWIKSRLHGLGYGREAGNDLTYAALAEILLGDPCEDFTAGARPIQDDRIQMLGELAGAKILGLEPPDALLSYLTKDANEDVGLAMLHVYGSYLQPVRNNHGRATSFALYRAGQCGALRVWDAAYLETTLGDQAAKQLALVDGYLLTDRNTTFLTTAQPELTQGGVFMAIGCAHLSGDTGMIEMLRSAGFTVTRIPLPQEATQ